MYNAKTYTVNTRQARKTTHIWQHELRKNCQEARLLPPRRCSFRFRRLEKRALMKLRQELELK